MFHVLALLPSLAAFPWPWALAARCGRGPSVGHRSALAAPQEVSQIEGQLAVAILAGGVVRTPEGEVDKALLRVGDETLSERVVRAWHEAERAERLFIVGPPEARELPGVQGTHFAERGPDVEANLRMAVEWLQGSEHAAICGADLPRVSPEAIERFCAMIPDDCDVGYPITRRETLEAAYPDVHWRYVKLRDGQFTGGTVAYVRPEAVAGILGTVFELFGTRKSSIGLASILGAGTAIRYLLRRLSVADVLQRAEQTTGLRLAVLMDAPPELCIDIDTAAQIPAP